MKRMPILAFGIVGLAALLLLLFGRDAHDPAQETARVERAVTDAETDRTIVAPLAVPEEARTTAARERTDDGASRATILIEGRVLDLALDGDESAGRGAPGLVVKARQGLNDETAGTTAEDGTFRFELADPGERPTRVVVWTAPDDSCRPAEVAMKLQAGERELTGLRLLRYPFGDLVGRTIEPDGTPIPGVTIETKTEQTVTDDLGRFAFRDSRQGLVRDARKEGFLLQHLGEAQVRRKGGFEPLDIVLAATTQLAVRVEDASGAPFPAAKLRLVVTEAEPFGHTRRSWSVGPQHLDATTDADGLAVFPAVWTRQKLRIRADAGGHRAWCERTRGDALLPNERTEGAPLVLAPGEDRVLRLVLPTPRTIVGQVFDPDGAPSVEASVAFSSLDPRSGQAAGASDHTRTDANGRFELVLASHEPLRLGRVRATQGDPERNMGWRGASPGPRFAAFELLDFEALPDGPLHVTLRLVPTLAIEGRVVDGDGRGVRAKLTAYATRLSAEAPGHERALRQEASTDGGQFVLDRLTPGTYDLCVIPDIPHAELWLRDVPAGTEDLAVRVEEERLARVTIEARCDAAESAQFVLLHGRYFPYAAGFEGGPDLARETLYDRPRGWPPACISLVSGVQRRSDEHGWVTLVLSAAKEGSTSLHLNPGWYWFGAKARAAGGVDCFPIGTGLVHLGEGDYRMRFELVPTVPLEGKVTGAGLSPDLCVALADADGELLLLDTLQDELQAVLELSSAGGFAYEAVPCGDHRLRVGTRAELVAGGFRYEQPIAVGASGTAPVLIELR